MIAMQYPAPQFKMKNENGREMIFDSVRKKWVVLTPEEWVRQNFIQALIQTHFYPVSLMAVEKEIQLGDLKKRFDILVYDQQHRPWMLVECKASSVDLNENVLMQLLRYKQVLPVSFLLITNGELTFGWEKRGIELQELSSVPSLLT